MIKHKYSKKHFTLVEIIAVMAILAVLMGLGLGIYSVATGNARRARTDALIKQLEVALEAYKAKHGYYIQTFSDNKFYLDAVEGDIVNGSAVGAVDKYKSINNFAAFVDLESMRNSSAQKDASGRFYIVDAWDRPLYYRCPGSKNTSTYDIISGGGNNKVGDTNNAFWNGTFHTDVPTLSDKKYGNHTNF